MNPICRHSTVPFMYLIIRNSLRSHVSSQRVIILVSAPTALSKPCIENRAMHIMFIEHLVAMWDNSPVAPLPQVPLLASRTTTNGSFYSSRNSVGAAPTLVLSYPDNSQNALMQSWANLSMPWATSTTFRLGS